VKYFNMLTITGLLTAIFLLAGCAGEPATAPPAQDTPTPDTRSAEERQEGDPDDVLLGATAAPTPIPVTPTATPKPPPPTPNPRPTATPAPEATNTVESKPLTELVEIPGGVFTMGRDDGADDEGPAHEVDLPTFYIEIFEVTNAQFAAFVNDTNYVTDAEQTGSTGWRGYYIQGKDNQPAVKVSWNDATAYCDWADRRLPTEAEWEKAARGPDGNLYPWGNNWNADNANVKESGFRGTTQVGSFAAGASPYGVFDMGGNVWEWTADWYQPYPGNTVPDDFYGEKFRVVRGGGWFDEPDQVLTVNRSSTSPKAANDDIGFRCAADPE